MIELLVDRQRVESRTGAVACADRHHPVSSSTGSPGVADAPPAPTDRSMRISRTALVVRWLAGRQGAGTSHTEVQAVAALEGDGPSVEQKNPIASYAHGYAH
jgi:hypothetical protein